MLDSLPPVEFKIFTKALEAVKSDGDRMRLKTVASSTLTDRQGDRFTEKALASMAASAMQQMTIFLNHKYQVPEDVLGTVTNAEMRRVEIEKDGVTEPGADLLFDIDINTSNERAVKTWEAINGGTKLGCSIGARVMEGNREKDGTYVIDGVDLMEASIIGIPAQPRAWVEYAVKSLIDDEAEDAETVTISGLPDDSELVVTTGPSKPKFDQPEETPESDQPDADHAEEGADEVEAPAVSEDDAEVQTPVEAGSEEPAAEPEPTESDQEAPPSDPESADEGAEAMPKSAEPEVESPLPAISKEFADLAGSLQKMTTELVITKRALAESESIRTKQAAELESARANVAVAVQLVEKIAQLPIGSRASHREVINDFRQKLSGVYDDEFLKMLTSGDTNG